jgi:hypothetical protein
VLARRLAAQLLAGPRASDPLSVVELFVELSDVDAGALRADGEDVVRYLLTVAV